MLYGIAIRAGRRITLFWTGYRLVVIDQCRNLPLSRGALGLRAALKSTAIIGIDCKTGEGGIVDKGRQLDGEASVRYRDVFNKLVISTVMTGNAEQIKIGQDALPFYTEIKNPSARCIVIQ